MTSVEVNGKYTKGTKVRYGWWVGTHIQLSDSVYLYVGKNSFGDHILENPESGAVFLAKAVCRCD